MGYSGYDFSLSLTEKFNKVLEIIKRPRKYYWVPAEANDVAAYLKGLGHEVVTGFKVQPTRWVVERTFAWLGKYRRLSKDYEFKATNSENFIYVAMIRNMLRRISKF